MMRLILALLLCANLCARAMAAIPTMGANDELWNFGSPLTNTGSYSDIDSMGTVIAHYAADSNMNTTHNWSATLTPSDVDVSNNKINNSGLDFAYTRPTIASTGLSGNLTPVYFEPIGGGSVLPAPFVQGTPYFAVNNAGGGVDFYPYATDADADDMPGGVLGEDVPIGNNAIYDVNKIDITSAGTGSFRVYTNPTISKWTDLVNKADCDLQNSSTNINNQFELLQDSKGKFVRTLGPVGKLNYLNSHTRHGKIFNFSGNNLATKALYANNRVLYQIIVARVPYYDRRKTPYRQMIANTAINTGTGIITKPSHGFATGDFVKFYAPSPNVLPTPNTPYETALTSGAYARSVTSGTLSLHPTSTDATNNTNVITYSSAGSGEFGIVATKRVADQPQNQYASLDINSPSGSNDHVSVLAVKNGAPTGFYGVVTPARVDIANNSRINTLDYPQNETLQAWAPPDTVMPIRVDTGLPLAVNTKLYASVSSSATATFRLHDSLANAQGNANVSDASSTHPRFSATSTGEFALYPDDGQTSAYELGANVSAGGINQITTRIDKDEVAIYMIATDFNNPSYSFQTMQFGKNGNWIDILETNQAKGNMGAATNDTVPWLGFNSAQGHVPGKIDAYEIVVGTSATGVPTAEIKRIVDLLKAKYNIGTQEGNTIAGKKGNANLVLNQSVFESQTPSWSQDTAGTGTNNYNAIPGVRFPNTTSTTGRANRFEASNTYGAGVTTYTLFAWFTEDFVSPAKGSTLYDVFVMARQGGATFGTKGLTYDHTSIAANTGYYEGIQNDMETTQHFEPVSLYGRPVKDSATNDLAHAYPWKSFFNSTASSYTGMTTDGYAARIGTQRTVLLVMRARPNLLYGNNPLLYATQNDLDAFVCVYGDPAGCGSSRGTQIIRRGTAHISFDDPAAKFQSYMAASARTSAPGYYHSAGFYNGRWLTDKEIQQLFYLGPFAVNLLAQ